MANLKEQQAILESEIRFARLQINEKIENIIKEINKQNISADVQVNEVKRLIGEVDERMGVLKKKLHKYTDLFLMETMHETSTETFKNQEEEDFGYLKRFTRRAEKAENLDYKIMAEMMFNKLIHSDINGLHAEMNILKTENKKTHQVEAKMYELMTMHEIYKELDFNKYAKKSFSDWFKESNESCNYWEAVYEIKIKAIDTGARISNMLVRLMLFLPNNDHQEIKQKFTLLIDLLLWLTDGEKSVNISRFLDVIVLVERMRDSKKAVSFQGIELHNIKFFTKGQVDSLINRLLKHVMQLEIIWMHPGLPVAEMSLRDQDAFPLLKSYVEDCEEDVGITEVMFESFLSVLLYEINELEFLNRKEPLNIDECDQYRAVSWKINKLWDQNPIEELENDQEQQGEVSCVSVVVESLEITRIAKNPWFWV